MKTLQFIAITPEEFKESIRLELKKELDDLRQNFQPKVPPEYLTRKQVSELLSIDISTVHNWTVKGKIQAYGIGNRVYYLRSEIQDAIKPLNH